MEPSFSWQNFDRMARVLESLGYIVLVFGPLTGIGLLVFGEGFVRVAGLIVIAASVLIAVYHFSFSLMMHAIRGLINEHPEVVTPKT